MTGPTIVSSSGNGTEPLGADAAASRSEGPAVTGDNPSDAPATSDVSRKDQVIRDFQSRADRAEATLQKYGALTPEVMARLGTPEQVIAAGELVARMLQDPKGMEVIRAINAGQGIPSGSSGSGSDDVDDEYLTDEQREIRELRAKLDRADGKLANLTATTAQQHLTGHINDLFASDFAETTPEQREKMLAGALKTVEQLSGNEEYMRSLTTPEGRTSARTLLLSQLDNAEIVAMGERAYKRKQGMLQAAETDSPSRSLSTGDEPPPDFFKNAKGNTRNAAAEAIRFAMRQEGRSEL